jgi:hypothetical protein
MGDIFDFAVEAAQVFAEVCLLSLHLFCSTTITFRVHFLPIRLFNNLLMISIIVALASGESSRWGAREDL